MNEIWKPIKDFENHYEISNLGRVKSLVRKIESKIRYNTEVKIGGKVLKNTRSSNGYVSVWLSKNGLAKPYAIHRLVAITFIDNPKKYRCVNHKDGNKLNNHVDNLEWASHKENTRHAYEIGLFKNKKAVPVSQYSKSGKFIKKYLSQVAVEIELGISRKAINHCARGVTKSAGGYVWRY